MPSLARQGDDIAGDAGTLKLVVEPETMSLVVTDDVALDPSVEKVVEFCPAEFSPGRSPAQTVISFDMVLEELSSHLTDSTNPGVAVIGDMIVLDEMMACLTKKVCTVRAWWEYDGALIPLPHPSPRNNIWLKKNPWFELEVVPELQRQVKVILQC
jgi:hypothetical protein